MSDDIKFERDYSAKNGNLPIKLVVLVIAFGVVCAVLGHLFGYHALG